MVTIPARGAAAEVEVEITFTEVYEGAWLVRAGADCIGQVLQDVICEGWAAIPEPQAEAMVVRGFLSRRYAVEHLLRERGWMEWL